MKAHLRVHYNTPIYFCFFCRRASATHLGNHLRQCAPYFEESIRSEVNAICKRFALFIAHFLMDRKRCCCLKNWYFFSKELVYEDFRQVTKAMCAREQISITAEDIEALLGEKKFILAG